MLDEKLLKVTVNLYIVKPGSDGIARFFEPNVPAPRFRHPVYYATPLRGASNASAKFSASPSGAA